MRTTLLLSALVIAVSFLVSVPDTIAQDCTPGIGGCLEDIEGQIDVPNTGKPIRDAIRETVFFIVGFAALAAVVTIIISGFVLIFGLGSEGSVTRARKIIIYTVVGLIVLFFATVIVSFFVEELPDFFT